MLNNMFACVMANCKGRRCCYFFSSDVVPAQSLAALFKDKYIDFVHLVLQKVATGFNNEVAALKKI